MIDIAASGQRLLCQGQGQELLWARQPKSLSTKETIEIFRKKTAPAFEVALRLGAVYAESDSTVEDAIRKYSEALGIAYQIRDDLDDWHTAEMKSSDREHLRPSLILAMIHEQLKKDQRTSRTHGTRQICNLQDPAALGEYLTKHRIPDQAERLKETYKEQAIQSLKTINNTSFKSLLRRVIGKIFNDLQIRGWCSEFETRNAPGRSAGS